MHLDVICANSSFAKLLGWEITVQISSVGDKSISQN